MFSCDDLRTALSDYLDQELEPELRRHIEQHLAECRVCQVLYDSTRKTVRIVMDATTFELPEAAAEQFIKRTMSRLGPRPPAGSGS